MLKGMVLLTLTLMPIAVLIVVPLMQRASFRSYTWQGQLTQAALWSLLPLGVLWTLSMLDSGAGVLALAPSVACLGLLMFGTSGGWPALLSGRLAQGGLLLAALLAFYLSSGFQAIAAAGLLALLAIVGDALLDRLGPAPGEPHDLGFEAISLKSPELSGTLVGARQPASAQPPQAQPSNHPPAASLSDRPPLPPPGTVSRWTAQQVEAAAQQSLDNLQADQDFKRSRRLNS